MAKYGIERIGFWDVDQASSGGIILGHLRKTGLLTINEEGETDYRDREFPNFLRFKAEYEDMAANRPLLYYLVTHSLKKGVNCEIIARKLGANQYDGVFQFIDPEYMGLIFTYELNGQRRYAKITLEQLTELLTGNAIVNAAITNTPLQLSPNPYPTMEDNSANHLKPNFHSLVWNGSTIFAKKDILEFSVKYTTITGKNLYEQSFTNWLGVEIMFKVSKAAIGEMKAFAEMPKTAALVFRAMNSSTAYEEHEFASGVLTRKLDFQVGDEARDVTITFKGRVQPEKLTYNNPVNATNHKYSWAL